MTLPITDGTTYQTARMIQPGSFKRWHSESPLPSRRLRFVSFMVGQPILTVGDPGTTAAARPYRAIRHHYARGV